MKKFRGFSGLLVWIVSTMALAQTAKPYIAEANQAYAMKDFAKAMAYYQKAAQVDSGSAASYQGMGNCHYQLGEKAEALADYEKALGFNPNNSLLTQAIRSLRNSASVDAVTAPPTPTATSSPYPGPSDGNDSKAESKKGELHRENSVEEAKAYQLSFSKKAY
ncbi:MAG TPA: tetratricopeptide repeat protein, partial [bacterium]